MSTTIERFRRALEPSVLYRRVGRLVGFNGLVIEAEGPEAAIGELCRIVDPSLEAPVLAEVVGFRSQMVLLMPFGRLHGAPVGATIEALGYRASVTVSPEMLGRVFDAFGQPLDGLPPPASAISRAVLGEPINPLARAPLNEALETGVRVVDALVPLAKGQRIGVFAGSGVGKSTLLGMMAGQVKADVIVVGLIGERGREVADFLTDALTEEGRSRSVLIVATADQPALMRTLAVHSAHAVAEYFRDRGDDVLLIVDSITRFAMAQREVGLASGEPPTSRGYPPSVFNQLPQILERGGRLKKGGSITAIYSVLVEGDDMNEPVADHMRAILDGHVVLSRDLAARGQLPAVEVLSSVSRLQSKICDHPTLAVMERTRAMMATFESSRDLIDMGAYQTGSNAAIDEAIRLHPRVMAFLRQTPDQRSARSDCQRDLRALMDGGGEA